MSIMGSFIDGMRQVIVLHPTPPEEAMRKAFEAVGRNMWWAIGKFNDENNLVLQNEQMELPIDTTNPPKK